MLLTCTDDTGKVLNTKHATMFAHDSIIAVCMLWVLTTYGRCLYQERYNHTTAYNSVWGTMIMYHAYTRILRVEYTRILHVHYNDITVTPSLYILVHVVQNKQSTYVISFKIYRAFQKYFYNTIITP